MRSIFILLIVSVLLGCEATAVKNTAQIKTKVKLNSNLSLPLNLPVAFYVDKSDPPQRKINFYGKLEEAAELVLEDMFGEIAELKQGNEIYYFVELAATSEWDYMWGGYESNFTYTIKSPDGEIVFSRAVISKASGSGGLYDINAVYNAFAKTIKELTTEFLNTNVSAVSSALQEGSAPGAIDIALLLPELKHGSSGTGFFFSDDGLMVTAAHTIENCIATEVHYQGQQYSPTLLATSTLLDLAVLKVDTSPESFVSVNKDNQISLGKPLFVTGFPLSDILSGYPSLTVGNVTSLGGLKGAKGSFQFSAPIQPGNSGGAIVDYKGNLLGVVSATLNQAMMLQAAGTTTQNVNFGVEISLLSAFLENNNIDAPQVSNTFDFEQASQQAVKYTTQVLCYE